jgi:putative DNA primase/helicase
MSNPQLKLVTSKINDAELNEIQAEINAKEKASALEKVGAAKNGDVLPPTGAYTLDDLSNAERFIAKFGSDIYYLLEAKKWLFWDRTHWSFDQENFVYDLACEFVKDLYSAENARDAETFKHAKRSNNASGIEALLKIVRNKKTIETKNLDSKHDLFNCLTGTIHLPTGEIRPHDRNDLITKLSPFHYNEDAPCDRFNLFLEDIQPNASVRNYLQQALGYSMSATYSDRAFFILYGFGRNGKSVFVDLFSRIFGNYSQNTTADSLMKKSGGNGIPNDIARLKGSRFITCSETEEGKQLHESLLKALTGGDKITARFLFGEYFDFYFSGKLWIVTNHKPTIRDMSQGFWDRLKLIPFTTQINKEDQIDKDQLLNMLLDEASGILAWLVEGYRQYNEHRQLTAPEEIEKEIEAYKYEQDSLAQFIAECIEKEDYARLDNRKLFGSYMAWCKENNMFAPTKTLFSRRMKERGFIQHNSGGRYWEGLRLIDPT